MPLLAAAAELAAVGDRLSFSTLFHVPATGAFAGTVDTLCAIGAAAAVLPRTRRGWAPWRRGSWLAGLLLAWVACSSALAVAPTPSRLVVQHVLAMMAAAPLLVAGCPACRRAHRRRARPTGARRPGAGTGAVVAGWFLYYGSMSAFFLSPLLGEALRRPWALDCSLVAFLAVGAGFWTVLLGATRADPGSAGPLRSEPSTVLRVAGILTGMPVETVVGIALMLWPRPVAGGTTVAATHEAGLLLWLLSMLSGAVALGAVLGRWALEDTRRIAAAPGAVAAPAPQASPDALGDDGERWRALKSFTASQMAMTNMTREKGAHHEP